MINSRKNYKLKQITQNINFSVLHLNAFIIDFY